MKTLNKLFLFLMLSLPFVISSCTVENTSFSDWNKNNDEAIQKDEFKAMFTKLYSDDWDVIDDQTLDDEDFYTLTFEFWDLDGDNALVKQEWDVGYANFFGEFTTVEYDEIDFDTDGRVTHKEYVDAIVETRVFNKWDENSDNVISEEELANGVFGAWDQDNDGELSKEEFDRFDEYYKDI